MFKRIIPLAVLASTSALAQSHFEKPLTHFRMPYAIDTPQRLIEHVKKKGKLESAERGYSNCYEYKLTKEVYWEHWHIRVKDCIGPAYRGIGSKDQLTISGYRPFGYFHAKFVKVEEGHQMTEAILEGEPPTLGPIDCMHEPIAKCNRYIESLEAFIDQINAIVGVE